MSIKSIVEDIQRGIDIVSTLESEPIAPYVASVVLELEKPHLYCMVGTLGDFRDILHCLEKSKFSLWGSVWPKKPNGDLFTALTFKRGIGRFCVLLTVSVPNTILSEYNNPQPTNGESESDF